MGMQSFLNILVTPLKFPLVDTGMFITILEILMFLACVVLVGKVIKGFMKILAIAVLVIILILVIF